MLKSNSFIFGFFQICKEYDMKSNSIITLLDEIDFEEINKFNIYLSCKTSNEENYNVFLIFSNKNKFLIADQFEINNEEINKDGVIFECNRVYEFKENNFPEKGVYNFELYAITNEEYLSQQEMININGNQALYDFLRVNESNLLYKTYFKIK